MTSKPQLQTVPERQPCPPQPLPVAEPISPEDVPWLTDVPAKVGLKQPPKIVFVPYEPAGFGGLCCYLWPGVILLRETRPGEPMTPGSSYWAKCRLTYLHECVHDLIFSCGGSGGHHLPFFATLLTLALRLDDRWMIDMGRDGLHGWTLLDAYDCQSSLIGEPVWVRWKLAEAWALELYEQDLSAEEIAKEICARTERWMDQYPDGWKNPEEQPDSAEGLDDETLKTDDRVRRWVTKAYEQGLKAGRRELWQQAAWWAQVAVITVAVTSLVGMALA